MLRVNYEVFKNHTFSWNQIYLQWMGGFCPLHWGVRCPVAGPPGLRFTSNLPPSAAHPPGWCGICMQSLGSPCLPLLVSNTPLLAHLCPLNMLPKFISVLHNLSLMCILALEWPGPEQCSALLQVFPPTLKAPLLMPCSTSTSLGCVFCLSWKVMTEMCSSSQGMAPSPWCLGAGCVQAEAWTHHSIVARNTLSAWNRHSCPQLRVVSLQNKTDSIPAPQCSGTALRGKSGSEHWFYSPLHSGPAHCLQLTSLSVLTESQRAMLKFSSSGTPDAGLGEGPSAWNLSLFPSIWSSDGKPFRH